MTRLFINIRELIQVEDKPKSKVCGKEMSKLPTIKNAYLKVKDAEIIDFGEMVNLNNHEADETINLEGKSVLPAYCDSHTHIVFAGNREQEFADRIKGMSYEEIAARGGGILNSAKLLQNSSEEDLYRQSAKRVEEVMTLGTGAIEIKSGYGLNKEAELKMLRVIKQLDDNYPITIKATFLGAHALPLAYLGKKEEYLNDVIQNILPEVADQGLAEYIDIFCESGYFSVADTEKLMQAAANYGLKPKIHVNQFNAIGGIQAGVAANALSVNHLEVVTDADISNLKANPSTMPVALPSCSFFLSIPYTPARKLIDSGLGLALATDYNPGSTPSGNMNFVIATACIKMKMTPEEAFNAATINGAYAMGLETSHGSIAVSKKANFIITKEIPSYSFLPYSFGSNLIEDVYIEGEKVNY